MAVVVIVVMVMMVVVMIVVVVVVVIMVMVMISTSSLSLQSFSIGLGACGSFRSLLLLFGDLLVFDVFGSLEEISNSSRYIKRYKSVMSLCMEGCNLPLAMPKQVGKNQRSRHPRRDWGKAISQVERQTL